LGKWIFFGELTIYEFCHLIEPREIRILTIARRVQGMKRDCPATARW
jgi:hypothetical protein